MERKRKILNEIVAFEEFRQMITDGFLPGQLSLEESVRYFDILKNRSFEENYSGVEPVTGKRYEADLSREDFLEIFPGDVSYELMKDAFIRYGKVDEVQAYWDSRNIQNDHEDQDTGHSQD